MSDSDLIQVLARIAAALEAIVSQLRHIDGKLSRLH